MYAYNINIHIIVTINICIKKYISGIPLMYMNININITRNIIMFIHIFTCIKLIRTKIQTKVRVAECSNWHLKYFLRMFYRKSNQNSVTSELQRHMAA